MKTKTTKNMSKKNKKIIKKREHEHDQKETLINFFLILFNVVLIVTFIVTTLDPGTILEKVQLIEDGATGPL